MPFIPFDCTPISQRVTNRTFGDQQLAQVATLSGFAVDFDLTTHELSLTLKTRVDLHGLVAGELGEPIPAGKGLSSRTVLLYANNNCAVYFNPDELEDPRNGEILYYKITLPGAGPLAPPTVAWQRVQPDGSLGEPIAPEAVPEPVLAQGNAFAQQLNYPLVLAQLIRHHLAAADAPPFNKYA